MANFCSNCGAELAEDSKFCSQCGKKTSDEEIIVKDEDVFEKLKRIREETDDLVIENNIDNLFYGSSTSYNTKTLHMNHLRDEGYINDEEVEEIRKMILNDSLGYDQYKSSKNNGKANYKAVDMKQKQKYKENKKAGIVSCPKCGSTSITTTNKKLSVKRGVAGAILGTAVPGVGNAIGAAAGAVAGGLSSKKIYNVCMNCGHRWNP